MVNYIWLVVYLPTPLKNVGVMTFPTEWKKHVPKHQVFSCKAGPWLPVRKVLENPGAAKNVGGCSAEFSQGGCPADGRIEAQCHVIRPPSKRLFCQKSGVF